MEKGRLAWDSGQIVTDRGALWQQVQGNQLFIAMIKIETILNLFV